MRGRLTGLLAAVLAVVVVLALILGSESPVLHQSAGGSVHPPGWGKPAPRTFSLGQSGPTAVMFDSTTPSAFPPSPFAFAGYTAGLWPNYLGLVRAYPHAHAVSIAIGWGYRARCLDVEPGDASPSQVVAWVRADIAAGFHKPCVYSSYWEFVNQVRPALAAGGIARSSVWEWDASYTGRPGITPSFDATQFTDKAYGRNLDESTVSLAFLGLSPMPKPRPLPVCYSHRISRSACSTARARIARAQGAAASSQRALTRARRDVHGNGCQRPYRRLVCRQRGAAVKVLSQRVRYFSSLASRVEAAS